MLVLQATVQHGRDFEVLALSGRSLSEGVVVAQRLMRLIRTSDVDLGEWMG
jgi:hypothetical protein